MLADPVLIIPTRLPVNPTPSCGHCPVWHQWPTKRSSPSNFGTFTVDKQPTAVIRNFYKGFVGLGPNPPAVGDLVIMRHRDTGVKLDVPRQIETVGDMVEVTRDLRLTGIALGPHPFTLQVGGESVPLDVAFGIAPRAGIAVPVPCAAHAFVCFQCLHRQAKTVAQM
jgi:hypothetical protein